MQNIIFKKLATLRIKWYYFYFADRPTNPIFFAVLPVGQKINLVSPNISLFGLTQGAGSIIIS